MVEAMAEEDAEVRKTPPSKATAVQVAAVHGAIEGVARGVEAHAQSQAAAHVLADAVFVALNKEAAGEASPSGLWECPPSRAVSIKGCQNTVFWPCPGQNSDVVQNIAQNIRPGLSTEEKSTAYGALWTSLSLYPEVLGQTDVENSRVFGKSSSPGYRILILTAPGVHAAGPENGRARGGRVVAGSYAKCAC